MDSSLNKLSNMKVIFTNMKLVEDQLICLICLNTDFHETKSQKRLKYFPFLNHAHKWAGGKGAVALVQDG